MKIVDRKTFLALPAGTVFAKYADHQFEQIEVKADTCGEDFVTNGLIPMFEGWESGTDFEDGIDAMVAGEQSPPFDYDSYGRDGLFDQDQLFAVFEKRDVEAMIAHLQEALKNGY